MSKLKILRISFCEMIDGTNYCITHTFRGNTLIGMTYEVVKEAQIQTILTAEY